MQLKQLQAIKSRINEKIERGDYVTLSKVLETTRNGAAMRYKRNNPEAVTTMRTIVDNREKLIKACKQNLLKNGQS